MRPGRTLRPDIRGPWGRRVLITLALVTLGLVGSLPATGQSPAVTGRPGIVISSAVLGAVVQELVGDRATLSVLMGNGVDPHDWSPSARDVEALHGADLVVVNGLGLEATLDPVLDEVAGAGVPVFRAAEHIGSLRSLDDGVVHHDATGASHGPGVPDPHFWVDPLSMRDVVVALASVMAGMGVDVADRAADLMARLEALDIEVRTILEVVPAERRQLVTGHESMGYFADRYGFELVGAVIPGLSSQGEVSASQLSAISALIRERAVPAIFAEVGTPQAVVDAIAGETGAQVVELPSHALPADGSYLTFIRDIATVVATALA